MRARSSSFWRRWFVPVVLLTSVALAIFWSLYAFDRFFSGSRPGGALFDYLAFDPLSLTDAVSGPESVTSKDFWEIIDRGRNFEYMPPAQRAACPRSSAG